MFGNMLFRFMDDRCSKLEEFCSNEGSMEKVSCCFPSLKFQNRSYLT